METSLERIKQDIEKLSGFTATPGAGVTRFTYSAEDRKARDYFLDQCGTLGLKTKIDGVGNIRARREGLNPDLPVVMSGSHIDTVLHGGKFDGIAGCVGALEAIRVLEENGVTTKHPVELVIFAEEEGSNFGSTMAGSKAMTGKYSVRDIKSIKNDQGVSMYDMAANFGLHPDRIATEVIRPEEIKAMIELHIEQGAVLDNEKISVGIVAAIAESKCLKIEFHGVSNHAGSTPMNVRHDPMQAAAMTICQIDTIVKKDVNATIVGTVGKILCHPNMPNIIPEKVTITADVRDVQPGEVSRTVSEIEHYVGMIARHYDIRATMSLLGESNLITLSGAVSAIIENAAKEKGIRYKRMNSGAVHDAALMAGITDVGMIFVPSIGGRSHAPEEMTKYEDIKIGADVLLRSLVNAAG